MLVDLFANHNRHAASQLLGTAKKAEKVFRIVGTILATQHNLYSALLCSLAIYFVFSFFTVFLRS
ncbi:MAG: hypothetical protein AAF153_03565 [Pseudomonadota bacterium]